MVETESREVLEQQLPCSPAGKRSTQSHVRTRRNIAAELFEGLHGGGSRRGDVGRPVAGPQRHAGENNTIKIALVGCGGRGTGAALNALSTKGPTKLWAVADVFQRPTAQPKESDAAVSQASGRAQGATVHRHGRLQEGDRLVGCGRHRAAGHTAGVPADPRRVCRAAGPQRVHGKIVRRRRPRHSPYPQGGRSGHKEESQSGRRPDEPALQALGRNRRQNSTTAVSARSSPAGPTASTAPSASRRSRPA